MSNKTSLMVLVTVCVMLMLVSCSNTKDKEEIIDTWNEYIISLKAKDGSTALSLVDDNTIKYYDGWCNLIRYADSNKLERYNFTDRLLVLRMRLSLTRDSLLTLSGKQFFIYCVNNELFGEGIDKSTLDKIVVKDKTAKALLYTDTTKNMSFPIEFAKQQGHWKINFTAFYDQYMPLIAQYFTDKINERGISEKQFMKEILDVYDLHLSDSTWLPLLIQPV